VDELPLLRDLVVIFVVSVLVVATLRRVGIPSIVGFIVAGVAIGPRALGLIDDVHEVEMLAEIGVALLLFGIGLELPLSRLRRLWRPILIGGALQVGVTAATTAAVTSRFGVPTHSAIFLGLVVAVSSTAIVLRGLEARGEIDAPHGRLTLGILIFQDLSVIPMVLAVPLLATGAASTSSMASAGVAALGAVLALAAVVVAAWLLVPRALHMVASTRQRDLFVLTVFLVSLGTAWLASLAGVSLALGAFLGGLVVAGSEYRHQALAELVPFREVFTSIFFVSVGMLLDPQVVQQSWHSVLGLVIVISVGKFLIVFVTTALMGLPMRVRLLAASSLAQIGEFSFVLIRMADGTELLSSEAADLLMPAIILSMLITPLTLALGPQLAAGAIRASPLSQLLGVRNAGAIESTNQVRSEHVIIAGFGLAGQELARSLRAFGQEYIIVDLNPENVRAAVLAGEPAYFGDVTSPDVLEHVGAAAAREIVIVVNDPGAAERAVKAARRAAPGAHILVRTQYVGDVEALLAAGASDVVPAELEVAAEVTARVLGRHGADQERLREHMERIRGRDPAGDA